jgi:ELWxxDGT repeat protein
MRFNVFNGAIYYAANDATNGLEHWKTDGTMDELIKLKSILEHTAVAFLGNSNFILSAKKVRTLLFAIGRTLLS